MRSISPRALLAVLLAACAGPASDAVETTSANGSASAAPTASAVALEAAAEPALQPPDKLDVAAVDAYVTKQLAAKGLTGLSLAIAHHGKIILAKGYGQAVREPAIPVGPDTTFGVGSVTKQFVCASVALLAEEGKLNPDDKVARYFPLATRANEITLADLGGHLSGYRDYYPLDFLDARMRAPVKPDDVIAKYAGEPLDFEPRSRFSYSNTGFTMLGRVVEIASGQPLGEFLEQRLFKPAGLEGASFAPLGPRSPRMAQGYASFAFGEVQPAEREADGWMYAAGGMYATATDLATWDLALIDGKIMKQASLKWMTTSRTLLDGHTTQYGCGLNLSTRGGEQVIQHSGTASGFQAFNTTIPATKSAVVLLSNRSDLNARSLHDELVALVLKREEPPAIAVKGPSVKEVAAIIMAELRTGKLDRSRLGADFNQYLNDERMRGVADRLLALGELKNTQLDNQGDRGGMEVASIRFTFESGALRVIMYRTPDGKVQQFLISKL